jgi:hypothetical protein
MMYVRVGGFSYSVISLIAMTIRLAHAQLATLLLLLATVVPATATGPGWSSEADALLAWKASLLDSAALSSWTQGVSACAWDGVICGHDNRVHKVAIKAFFSSLTPRLFPRSYRQVDPSKEKFDGFSFFLGCSPSRPIQSYPFPLSIIFLAS